MASIEDRFLALLSKKQILSCYYVSSWFSFQYNEIPLGIVVGLGVGITRDCSIVMIAQYFKKKREFVEVLTVAGSGFGIIAMSIFVKRAIETLRWR